MATKFTPLHDRILVRRVEEAATTRGGILIPDSAKDKLQDGEVMLCSRAKRTHVITSAAPAQCAMTVGRRSIMALGTERAAS
jgi:co-chaperonin GroES (HSP10)